MKVFLRKHYGVILLGVMLGVTIGLFIASYQILQNLNTPEGKMGHQAEELISLEADNDLLFYGVRDLHTLEYFTSTQETLTPPAHPTVGLGMGLVPEVITRSGTIMMRVRIARIMCDGPAHKAGLRVDDEVIFYNGHNMQFPVTSEGYKDLLTAIASVALSDEGSTVSVVVKRSIHSGRVVEIYQDILTAEITPLAKWKTDCTNSSAQEK